MFGMIESERNQNIIIAAAIIMGIISSGIIVVNAGYYSGSYALAHYVEVSLLDVRLDNYDPSNESLTPALYVTLNFKSTSEASGTAAITSFNVLIWLNRQFIQYPVFTRYIPIDRRELNPAYDHNYTASSSILEEHDLDILFDAYSNSNWTWGISVRYFYYVFEPTNDGHRDIGFSYIGVNLS
ncbi:MAG: hypothetical protein EAX95_06420 [Candidatus Thorarchaeota archaeon]|nr:hypothetical protein [Candidatus Thorarchaeota archaeon]